jgi:hypothetical protein
LVHLNRLSSSSSFPAGCDGQERAWAQAHFSHALAEVALAKITQCLRDRDFEVGAPAAESPFELGRFGRAKWRQFKAAQQLCRAQAEANRPVGA